MLRLPSRLSRMSRKMSTAVDPAAPPMLRFQKNLPHLPVPTISSTAAKYLETVRPHLSADAFASTQAAIKEFESSEFVKELQQRLQARANEPGIVNWLADWWNEIAYMGYRDPVVVYVSYFYVHLDDKRRKTPAARAASFVKAMLPFKKLVDSQALEPEKIRDAALCMDSYRWLFNSTRLPVKPSDTAHKFDPAVNDHVVFVRKNKFFKVPLSHNGAELSTSEFESQINKIIEAAGSEKGVPVGALTSDNRDNWAEARKALVASSQINEASLTAIEAAVVIICLDDTKPVSREAISQAVWTGDGRNRFYDKHQFIIFDNGRSGFLGEHSSMDGTSTLRLNEFMLGALAHNRVDHGSSSVRSDIPEPQELRFEINSKVKELITGAEQHFDQLVGQHDLHVLHYEGYGKDYMKKQKVSPDAWVQMVMQLAFHKMFGRPGVTYESAQTRKFQRGRTEVIRSASNESKAFTQALSDPDASPEQCAALFRKAAARHIQYAAWAADGQGVDRHLLGLKKVMKEGEALPKLYEDAAFARTSHWELSTSQLSSPYLDGWGYGEVVPDGYGLSYSIGDNYIRWTITSLKRQTADLRHYLAEASSELKAVMDQAAAAHASESKAKM